MSTELKLLSIEVTSEQDVVLARQRARQIASLLGFDLQGQTKIGTALSEIVRNAFRYAGGGRVEFHFAPDKHRRLVITVIDHGPGISNLEEVLAGRYVSKTGMGMGLIGTRRIMDRVEFQSTIGHGTTVTMSKFLPAKLAPITSGDFAIIANALSKGLPGDPLGEIQQQNQELLGVLNELNLRQADLVAVNKELEDTNRGVVALYAELDARSDFLRKTTEVKTRFLSNMTHEFRTPLNSIIALANMLLDKTDGELNPDQELQTGFILRSAQELTTLVDDLLDIAKVDAGKIAVRIAEFRVADLFGALKGMLRPLLGPSVAVTLEFDEPDSDLILRSDEGKVSQILRNFISNALKFTSQGNVRVTAACLDDRMVFSVADSGIGIRAEHIAMIFEEFGQIDTGVQQRFKGTGLGLPLSKRLAEILGGSVEVSSTVGIGSTFRLSLPMRYDGKAHGTLITDQQDEAPKRFNRQILVIDNDEVSRYLIRGLFPRNFEINEISDQDEVIRAVAHLGPDVIFLNVPSNRRHEGPSTLHKLKQDPETRQIPIIVYAHHPIDDAVRSIHAEADAIFWLAQDGKTASAAMHEVLAKVGLLFFQSEE